MTTEIKLINLGKLVAACWLQAEQETTKIIIAKYPDPCEEQITFLFSGELRDAVAKASTSGKIGNAFLQDLRSSIYTSALPINRYAHGLVAKVNLHDRAHEGKVSGADFGFIVRRPLVRNEDNKIKFHRTHARGLLAQAKLGRRADFRNAQYSWGDLTKPQLRLFDARSRYYSLLLYRLNRWKPYELQPFHWQLCKDHTVDEVQAWLNSSSFPSEISSADILHKLFAQEIGTANRNELETIVDPSGSEASAIDITIVWPKGDGPPSEVTIAQPQQQTQHLRQ